MFKNFLRLAELYHLQQNIRNLLFLQKHYQKKTNHFSFRISVALLIFSKSKRHVSGFCFFSLFWFLPGFMIVFFQTNTLNMVFFTCNVNKKFNNITTIVVLRDSLSFIVTKTFDIFMFPFCRENDNT